VVSIIFPIFVLTVEGSESGSGEVTLAEGRLLDAPLFISGPNLLYKIIKH
jgi:hypothetical protein